MTRWFLIALVVLIAGCSNDEGRTGPKDTTPPAQVLDLAGSPANDSTITLTWTAPGDDDEAGAAAQYDIRWSPSSLTEQTWDAASRCSGLPEPSQGGTSETHPVSGLPRGTPVRLALKAVDDADNESAISNVIRMQLPPPAPVCSLSVATLDFGSIPPSETAERQFSITNVGGGRLAGEVGIEGERFSMTDGAGSFSLGYREAHAVTVRFTPGISGPAEGSVTLGLDGCGPLPCTGRGSGSYCITDWDTLRFGNVNVGDHATWRVTLTNRGDHWTVVTPQLEGCTGIRIPYDQSFTLQPGDSRSLGVEFWPLVDGPVNCRLKLNAQGECDEVVLLGRGIGPQCWLSADGRGFGPVPVGTSVDWPFTIENRGGGRVEGTISAPASPDFMILSGAGPYTLLPSQSRIVKLRFAPQSAGDKSWTVETGTDACLDVRLWGTGMAGRCELEPDSLDFGDLQVGASEERAFEIRNSAAGLLTGAVSLVCPEFELLEGGGSFSLDNGQSRIVRVRFTPLSAGVKACSLETGISCGAVTLRGSAEGAMCAVEPLFLDFGTVPAWSEVERSITITNVGAGAWLTGRVSEPCPRFSLTRGAGDFSIRPGETREVVLRFNPDLAGPYSCRVDLGTVACRSVEAVGSAVGAICEITPPGIVFPSIRPRARTDTVIVIRNVGGGILGGQAQLSCPDFSIVAGGGTILLAHGESHAIGVRWSPTAEGPTSCVFRIGSTCDSIPLTGICIDLPPVCAVSADSLLFGIATAGRSGGTEQLEIWNSGGRILSGTIASDSPEFVITEGAGAFNLRAGVHRRVTVQFHPSGVGERRGTVTLGTPECPPILCRGFGVSYRVLAEMTRIDDVARLRVIGIGGAAYTARFGKLGTEETGWVDIGHYPGNSGTIDLTAGLKPGENQVRFTLENTACCDATVIVSLWKGSETVLHEEFHGDGHHDGIVYDKTVTVQAEVE